ncbi:MAG: hypothetical protein MUO89_09690 [Dehalococcoidia bacterium]|nr:hypothetical protein [Dehalococcoidia bacterium]
MVKHESNFNKPTSTSSAQALWESDKREFTFCALSLVGAKPRKKGDEIEGILGFVESGNKKRTILVQATGKRLIPGIIQDLLKAIDNEGAAIGLLISLHKPTLGMITDSVHAGSYESELWKKKFLKIQIRTMQELLDGKSFDIPQTYSLVKKAPLAKKRGETAQLL